MTNSERFAEVIGGFRVGKQRGTPPVCLEHFIFLLLLLQLRRKVALLCVSSSLIGSCGWLCLDLCIAILVVIGPKLNFIFQVLKMFQHCKEILQWSQLRISFLEPNLGLFHNATSLFYLKFIFFNPLGQCSSKNVFSSQRRRLQWCSQNYGNMYVILALTNQCPFCNLNETLYYLFFGCSDVQGFWKRFVNSWQKSPMII